MASTEWIGRLYAKAPPRLNCDCTRLNASSARPAVQVAARGKLVSSQFLLRPKPLIGESLSSWRQRAGWENGYRLFPLQDGRLRRADPDIGGDDSDLSWVAQSHALEYEDVRALALSGVTAIVASELKSRHHPPWWIPCRYGAAVTSHAAMYCPLCLKEDKFPYFRLAWRLGFNYACPAHSVRLLDRCTWCRASPWPAGCGMAEQLSTKFNSLRCCWRCGGDLAAAELSPLQQAPELAIWLRDGTANLGNITVPSIEAFRGLRAMCSLFIRGSTRAQIAERAGAYPQIASAIAGLTDERRLEWLDVEQRAHLVPAALDLLRNWPDGFRRLAKDCQISRMHFNGAYHQNPSWLNAFIDGELARQNRWVTSEDIRGAVRTLRDRGEQPTKWRVRQLLNWQGEIADALLQ